MSATLKPTSLVVIALSLTVAGTGLAVSAHGFPSAPHQNEVFGASNPNQNYKIKVKALSDGDRLTVME